MIEKPTLAYIEQRFPSLTTTFVYRELFALRERGFYVKPYSIHEPDLASLSAESESLIDETTYLRSIPLLSLIRTHLHWIIRRPYRYKDTLKLLLSESETVDEKRRAFKQFVGGVALANDTELQDVKHIHAHFSSVGASLALVAANLRDISFSFTAHNMLFTEQHLLKAKIEKAHFIVAISEYTRDFLIDYTDEPEAVAAKSRIVHCGIDVDAFRPIYDSSNSEPMIVAVAQLVERKGLHILIEACHQLAQQGQAFQCRIIGAGQQHAELQSMLEKYSLQSQVQLCGAVKQEALRSYLSKATLLALPCVVAENGDVDGIPVAIMEAMAMGLPVVSTAVSGIPDLITDGETGRLVPQKDPSALANVLAELLNDHEQCKKLGAAGSEFVANNFNLADTSSQLADLFIEQIGGLPILQSYLTPKLA